MGAVGTAPGVDPADEGSGPSDSRAVPSDGAGPDDSGAVPDEGVVPDEGIVPDGSVARPDEVEPPEGSDPLRFNKWMKRSATGAVLTGISLGLREALETTKKEPAFMIEASGRPEDPDNPIQLHFDPDNPADTVAVIRQPPTRPDQDQPPPAG